MVENTKSGLVYIKLKQLRPPRQVKGRYAVNFLQSHRRPAPEVITSPELLPIPDPDNTVRTDVEIAGES